MKRLTLIIGVIAILMVATSVAVAGELTIKGKLKRTVEPGGWLIAGQTNYLLLNAGRFQNGSWFTEETSVEAIGETQDVITSYMEGTPFEARSIQPTEQNATDSRKVTRVMVTGDSTIQAQPDTALLTLSVVTQAKEAGAAQEQNAARSDAVVKALKAAVGTSGEVKTSNYSLQPQRVYKEGQPPTITGYEARNSVTVTLNDLKRLGTVIDAAGGAGANDFGGIAFILRQDRPAKDRALSEATKEAISKAQVVAQALGGRVSRVIEVQEDGFQRPPQPVYQAGDFAMARTAAVTTPIEVGSLDIHSRVQLIAEIEIG